MERNAAKARSTFAALHTPSAQPSLEVKNINRRVLEMAGDELQERYHELVDKRLENSISLAETFELDRIEARLKLEEQDEIHRAATFRNEWSKERELLLSSIEQMLAQLRASS